jgi:protein subunit release factor A
MKAIIEIRPGEGGEDAKLLVQTQAMIYCRYAEKKGLTVEVEQQDSL